MTLTQGRDQTDTEAGKEAARKKQRQSGGSSLKDDTQDEDTRGGNESEASTNIVGEEG